MEAVGAESVVHSFLPSFKEDLLAVVNATEATVAFDATGWWYRRDGHSDSLRHVSASAVPRSGASPATLRGADCRRFCAAGLQLRLW